MELDEIIREYDEGVVPAVSQFKCDARDYLKFFLDQTDEDDPYGCDITIEPFEGSSAGVSSLSLPCITGMYLDEHGDVMIDEEGFVRELFDYSPYEIVQILKELENE